MIEQSSGLDNIITALKAYTFDSDELCFTGLHPTTLQLKKFKSAWSELDYFTSLNVENNFFKDYSDIYVLSGKFSQIEREVYKKLGFDFEKVENICKFYMEYMRDFKMHTYNYFYVKALFREDYAAKYDSFAGIVSDANYYSKEFSGGLNLRDSRIFIQFFLHYQDGAIHPRAKLTFPLSEEGYFSIIIGNDELYSVAEQVVKNGVMSEFKALLIDRYPDECSDVITFDEETLNQYLTVISMDKI